LRASGYQDSTITVNVIEGQTLVVPITLTPVSPNPTQSPRYPFGFSSIIPVFGSVVNQISIFGMNLQF
jgi:hypothetical protein